MWVGIGAVVVVVAGFGVVVVVGLGSGRLRVSCGRVCGDRVRVSESVRGGEDASEVVSGRTRGVVV